MPFYQWGLFENWIFNFVRCCVTRSFILYVLLFALWQFNTEHHGDDDVVVEYNCSA